MNETSIILFSSTLALGQLCQWLGWRLQVPAIVFLLGAGFILGPASHLLQPDKQLGELLLPFVSLSVAIILFEGSLSLNFSKISGLKGTVRNLITLGALISWILISISVHYLIGFSWQIAFLFGAIIIVSGPTVVIPLLKSLKPNANISNILLWEGILIDPIGALLSILVFEFIMADNLAIGLQSDILLFGKIITAGTLLGILGGYILGSILRNYWVPYYLRNYTTLSMVLFVFSIANFIASDSGLIAVTAMGIFMANYVETELEDIIGFKENVSLLLVSLLFIILSARIDLHAFTAIGWSGFYLLFVIQFIIRPAAVYLSSKGSKLSFSERFFIAWIAPRGIVAAAISSLFSIKLSELGYAEATELVPLTFFIIVSTVLFQSFTSRSIGVRLGLIDPEHNGVLIIGANRVSQKLAQCLIDLNYHVLLVDSDWSSVAEAKINGLNAFWGNPASRYAENNLNTSKLKYLLNVSSEMELNILSAKHFRPEFSGKNIYTIRTFSNEQGHTDKYNYQGIGKELFNTSFKEMEQLISQGGCIKKTTLTDKYTYEQYIKDRDQSTVFLFALDPKNLFHIYAKENVITPSAGWQVISLTK
jgi:NhaP-type Na+/H+ or K+/H+ antiporter